MAPAAKRRRTDVSTQPIQDSINGKPNYSYFSLPPEIRNQITTLALTGGHVYLQPRPYSRKLRSHAVFKIPNNASAPGVGLLATCRQAYEEGRVMYYTGNVFHLPQGTLKEIKQLLAKIKPEHLALMKQVKLKFSLLDLTPDALREIETANPRSYRSPHPTYIKAIWDYLYRLWVAKLYVARSSFSSLEELRIHTFYWDGPADFIMRSRGRNGLIGKCPIPLDHNQIFASPEDEYEKIVEDLLVGMAAEVAHDIAHCETEQMDWRGFKRWLNPEEVVAAEQESKEDWEQPERVWYNLGLRNSDEYEDDA